ncbi:alcohol dehydrogenase [Penicillium argentinense]|uniref:Alcohol dehydrogenase n=1 Tax=Penicillium argentinense TaxID=1131581 RepID=A0A9W9KKU7_9EURO|nr:alcohol dehydrogenase [Penicillium argentinense]KAJ5110025.1 alcohol dehydrogenase [Penicillium argentinense]
MFTATQAIVAREPEQPFKPNWSLEDVNVGEFGDDEVLVEVVATGICHTDLVLSSIPTGALGIAYPKIVGHEAAHPAYCDKFAVGNYVGRQASIKTTSDDQTTWSQYFGQSSFAKLTVANESSIVNAKDLIEDLDELKLFAPLGCGFQTGMGAVQNITSAGPEDVVLISGLGAVGMGAVMTAHIENCKAIIAVDRVKPRLELAKPLGATHTIDTSDPEFTTLDEAIRRLFPSGASVVIDTTGVPSIIEQSVQATTARGKFVVIGVPPLGYELKVNVAQHINVGDPSHFQNYRLTDIRMKSGRSILGCIEGDCVPGKAIPQMIKWYRDGKFPIDKLIDFFDATDFGQALGKLHTGETIKPVLMWK